MFLAPLGLLLDARSVLATLGIAYLKIRSYSVFYYLYGTISGYDVLQRAGGPVTGLKIYKLEHELRKTTRKREQHKARINRKNAIHIVISILLKEMFDGKLLLFSFQVEIIRIF